jgi:hypothetical protein
MPQAPNTVALDDHLKGVVEALQGAVNSAMRHMDEQEVVDRAIQDCKEILDVIMKGNVPSWLE